MRFVFAAVVSSFIITGTLSSGARAGVAASEQETGSAASLPGASAPVPALDLTSPLFQPITKPSGLSFDFGPTLRQIDGALVALPTDVLVAGYQPMRRGAQDIAQVEPVPSPSAVASGMVALAALAGVRVMRRFKLA